MINMYPARSGLRRLCELIPSTWSVFHPARKLLINSIRITNTCQQIKFLQKCKKNHVFPPALTRQKFPIGKFKVENGQFKYIGEHALDHTSPLSKLVSQNYSMCQKLVESISKTTTAMQNKHLRFMISIKYMERRKFEENVVNARAQFNEIQNLPTAIRKKINRIINEECVREKSNAIENHKRKYARMANTQRRTVSRPQLEYCNKPEVEQKSGVIIRTAATFSNKVIPFLEKGAKYKLTPTTSELVGTLRRGTERLAIAMRYANPQIKVSQHNNNSIILEQSNSVVDISQDEEITEGVERFPLIKQITSMFDKADIRPPETAKDEIEMKIRKLKGKSQEWIKNIESTKIPPNFSQKQVKEIRKMSRQPNIQIEQTDKTSKIAIIDKEFAMNKIQEHLQNYNYFEQLSEDPSLKFDKEFNNLLGKIFKDKDKEVPDRLKYNLPIKYSEAPYIFSFQKDHKDTYPECKIRPVQPMGSSSAYKADILVSKIFSQILPYLKYRIPNKQLFMERLKNIDASRTKLMASFDIESMFPSMPTSEFALNIVRGYLIKYEQNVDLFGFSIEDIIELLRFVLQHTYVEHNGIFYIQKSGVGTGCHSSPGYSEILVDFIYYTASIMTQTEPPGLSLYMDDAWVAWDKDEVSFQRFHDALNSVFPRQIVFTVEKEEQNKITFLDLTIIRKSNEFQHEFYQKPTHSGKYLDYESHCPQRVKLNIISSETRRIISNCSKEDLIWQHLERLRENLICSNYPPILVTKTITSEVNRCLKGTGDHGKTKKEYEYIYKIPYVNEGFTRKVQKLLGELKIDARVVPVPGRCVEQLFKCKEKGSCTCKLCEAGIRCSAKHAVYEATCKLCDEKYDGVSNRPIKYRMREHEASTRLANDRTALGQHMKEHIIEEMPTPVFTEKPDFSNLLESYRIKIVEFGVDSIDAYIREGLQIKDKMPRLNTKLDNGWVR